MKQTFPFLSLWTVSFITGLFGGTNVRAAEACGVPVSSFVLQYDDRGRPTLPVEVDGRREFFLFDTGGSTTAIEMDFAMRLDLPQTYADFTMTAVTGETSWLFATAKSFNLGMIAQSPFPMMILPGYDHVLREGEPAGILALDFFRGYELEVNFVADTLVVRLSENCRGVQPAIDEPQSPLGRLVDLAEITVLLDGIPLQAIVDTGATRTVLNMDTATELFGVDSDTMDGLEVADIGDGVRIYTRRFSRLAVGSLEVDQPIVELFPNVIAQSGQIALDGTPLSLSQLILGMDVLTDLKISFVAGEDGVRLSRGGAP